MIEHDCQDFAPPGFLLSGFRQDGELYTCPECGRAWVHLCDEATGCMWLLASERVRTLAETME